MSMFSPALSAPLASVFVPYLGINPVTNPPNRVRVLDAKVDGRSIIGGENNNPSHAIVDKVFDDEVEGNGEGDCEVDLPEHRHRGVVDGRSRWRVVETWIDVIRYLCRLICVCCCGHRLFSVVWLWVVCCDL